ncbi:MAG: aminotransferase class I/II-fold pyridoxal phosphate-dependent enzyme, partial [Planctomycetia bacterium]
ALADIAERRRLVLCADEIYDEMLYDGAEFVPTATLARNGLCLTFGGLSKIYRACGLRVGWLVFSGERKHARDFIDAVELLASLRLCSNVPGQYAVQTALGGYQSILNLTRSGGRLHATRAAMLEAVHRSKYLSVVPPRGAMYAFVRVHAERLPGGVEAFSDQAFALDLLQRKHVLVAPGSSFNVPYRDHFRVTLLPDAEQMADVFARIESLLDDYAMDG